MISVIVPTMWKGREIIKMLPLLNDHPLVGEIILIDNDPSQKDQATCELSKVKYLTYGSNIFVTAAWNRGYETAVNDKLLIINDDVIFSPQLVDAIYDHIVETNGTITIDPPSVTLPVNPIGLTSPKKVSDIIVKPCPNLKHKAAVIIGIHKNSYVLIPEEIMVYYNDSFLFSMCIKNQKPNLAITGAEVRTKMSTTVSTAKMQVKSDQAKFKEVFKRYGIPC